MKCLGPGRQKFKNSGVQELQEFRIKRARAKWLGSLRPPDRGRIRSSEPKTSLNAKSRVPGYLLVVPPGQDAFGAIQIPGYGTTLLLSGKKNSKTLA